MAITTSAIGGAYLNASMAESGVIVHMRLDKVMTAAILVRRIDPTFAVYVTEDGISVVQLDKALYGCVEAAHLWYLMLREKLEAYGFEAIPVELQQAERSGSPDLTNTACGRSINYMQERSRDRIILCIPTYTVPSYHSARRYDAQLSRDDVRFSRRRRSICDDEKDSR